MSGSSSAPPRDDDFSSEGEGEGAPSTTSSSSSPSPAPGPAEISPITVVSGAGGTGTGTVAPRWGAPPPPAVTTHGRDWNPAPGKTHARSASHVGILRSSETVGPFNKDHAPSIYEGGVSSSHSSGSVPSRVKGHQRAFSHGQMNEGGSGGGRGHKREGSKTDFILPEGHEQRERERDFRPSKKASLKRTSLQRRGHSREASRTESVYTIRDQKASLLQRIFFWKKKPVESNSRLVVPNHVVSSDVNTAAHPNAGYPSNRISTTKYTLLTFLPKNLFEQFHRFANLYFLFIVLLNFVPSVNAFAKELAILPLAFVLGVTALKDWFEDLRRRRSDQRLNARTCRVYSSLQGRYVKVMWADVRVGDVVHLSCDETVPADVVLLNSSDDQGVCYVESSDLDGETNLKQRQSVRGFGMDGDFEVSKFDSVLEVGPPTTKIYHFVGSIPGSGRTERIPLTKDNIILRDCVVKNTDFVEGIVVYAGRETKSLLNNGGTRYKRSKLEKQMNREVIWCIIILVLISLFSATGSALWQNAHMESYEVWLQPSIYLTLGPESLRGSIVTQSPVWVAFTAFWTFIILYQVLIPISLYVTVEIIKLMQIYHIHSDPHFKNKATKTNINCRALNITEELGQVEYVFTDKTGTLTENNMVFQRCSINGVDYEHSPLIIKSKQSNTRDSFLVNEHLQEELNSLELQFIYAPPGSRTAALSKASTIQQRQDSQRVLDFFFTLACCNTVIVAKHPHRDEMNASGMIIPSEVSSTSEDGWRGSPLACNSPRNQYLPSKNLLRSLFPSPRRSPTPSVVASSTNPPPPPPLCFPPATSNLKVTSQEILLNTFETVPEHSAAVGCSARPATILTRPNMLPIVPNISAISCSSRSPSPAPPFDSIKPIYEAESPDELALVDAAYKYGCRLLRRNLHSALVALPGVGVNEYEILNVLPFDSNRKRMSVIIKHPQTAEKILYCKGADSAILENLCRRTDEATQWRIMETQQQLNAYSKQGLRVLCMAKKVISDTEYEEWYQNHKRAESTLANREKKLSESYEKIETNMQLLGATGIEDRLQDGVPETVKALREAGIVVWVLTGDKQETAINIAYSCSLFSQTMEILKLNARTKEQTERTIGVYIQQIEERLEMERGSSSLRGGGSSLPRGGINGTRGSLERGRPRERGLVVDGRTLVYILDQRTNLKTAFLKLATHCQAVMCCRATPLQKALIVRIAKDKLKVLTLAVGDGANDVSMIQTADVGVGISGVEGRQAVMSSDFAITRFRHLEKLLLVHGHWCYERLARVILYFFYKNACFVFLLMWFQLYCGYSTSVMMDDLYLVMFNLLFTSLPPITVGIYDQDAPEDLLLAKPKLYAKTRLGTVYTTMSFWVNIIDAFYQSVVLFFVAVGVYEGFEVGLYEFGMTITHSCVVTQLLHIAIETKSWTIIHVGTLVLSVAVYYLFGVLYTVLCNGCIGLPSQYGELVHMVSSPEHWFCVLVSCVLALLPRFVARVLQSTFWPDEVTRALRERKAINKGQFIEKISRASSASSVFKDEAEDPTSLGLAEEEDASDAMSSLVTMTTLASTIEATEA